MHPSRPYCATFCHLITMINIIRSVWGVICLLAVLEGCTKDTSTDADTQAPSATILFPRNAAELKTDSVCAILAEARDNIAVAHVDFYCDDKMIGTVFSSPYQYSWRATGAAGAHSLTAKAVDFAGNIGSSSAVAVMLLGHVFISHKPGLASNPDPLPGAADVSTSPTLQWTCADSGSGPLTYDVFLDSNFPPTAQVAAGLTTASLPRTGLWKNTTYYWKVNAKNDIGAITMGDVWYFTTQPVINQPPVLPSLPDPADGATVVSNIRTLNWTCYDPESSPVTCDVFFGATDPPTARIASGESARSVTVTGLSSAVKYYWRVVARDVQGATTVGPVWSFTLAGTGTDVGDYFPLSLGKEFLYTYSGLEKAAGGGTVKDDGTHRWKVVETGSDGVLLTYTIRNIRTFVTAVQTPYYGPEWVTTNVADTVYFTMTESIADHVIGGLPGIGAGITIYRYHALSDGEVIAQTGSIYFMTKIKLNVGAVEFKYSWITNNRRIFSWILQ